MVRSMLAGGLLAASLLVTPASAAVNLIQNGGFEEPVLAEGTTSNVQVPGWLSNFITLDLTRPLNSAFFQPFDGQQFLRTTRTVSFTQFQSLTSGQEYQFSFAYRGNGSLTASIFDAVTGSFLVNAGIQVTLNQDWTIYSQTFVNNSSNNLDLTFSLISAASNGSMSLDGVRLTAVSAAIPEPATWAMMLIGFAGLGVAARRRAAAHAG